MKEIIVRQFINVEEPDKCGLPFVIGQFNVSCKSGENVKELVNFIYNRVFQLKHPSMHEVWFLDLEKKNYHFIIIKSMDYCKNINIFGKSMNSDQLKSM